MVQFLGCITGTRFANLLDTEFSAWIDGAKANTTAAVNDGQTMAGALLTGGADIT